MQKTLYEILSSNERSQFLKALKIEQHNKHKLPAFIIDHGEITGMNREGGI